MRAINVSLTPTPLAARITVIFLFPGYAPYPQKPGSYSSIILIFKLADIFVTLAIFLFTPMAVVLNIDPFHHILTQLSPYYTAQVSLHVWIGATFRVPLCILMMLDVARVFIYIGIMFVIACKIWLRYFYLIEEPYRVIRSLATSPVHIHSFYEGI